MNGLHLIRQLNDKAVEQEIEKRKLDDVATFQDVDPAPSGALARLQLDDVKTATATAPDDDGGRKCDHIVCNGLKDAFLSLPLAIQLAIISADNPIDSMAMTLYAVGQTDPDLARSALDEIAEREPLQGAAIVVELKDIANS